MNETTMTVREAARRRTPLDGTDAQALEHALSMTEAERDGALNQLMAARLHATQAEEALAERAKELDAAERAMDQQREGRLRAEQRLEETQARLDALALTHQGTLDRLHEVERQRADLTLRAARLQTDATAVHASAMQARRALSEVEERAANAALPWRRGGDLGRTR